MTEQNNLNKLETGQILVSSWGYDQTNIDFYQVVKGAEIGKFAQIKSIPSKWYGGDGYGGSYLLPDIEAKNDTTKIFKKKVQSTGAEFYIALTNYCFAYLWNNKPKLASGSH